MPKFYMNYIQKRIYVCVKLLMHKLDRKLHPTFEDQKEKIDMLPTQEKILKLWEAMVYDKDTKIMYSKDNRLLDSSNILLMLNDSGYRTGSVITVIDLREDKRICVEIDLPENIAKLFKVCFDDENSRRIKSLENKKRTLLSNSLDETITDWEEHYRTKDLPKGVLDEFEGE